MCVHLCCGVDSCLCIRSYFFFFFKQKTAYEMRISDWSSDVCSSDLRAILAKSGNELVTMAKRLRSVGEDPGSEALSSFRKAMVRHAAIQEQVSGMTAEAGRALSAFRIAADSRDVPGRVLEGLANSGGSSRRRSEEHTSELQSLMRTSYAVFCLK